MTFEELEQTLPNGFHDAAIREISLDVMTRSIAMALDLLTGQPGEPNPDLYRPGTLKIVPAYLFFVEPPDLHYSFVLNGSRLKVGGDFVKAGQNEVVDRLLEKLPTDATAYRFFLEKWNSFLYVAGGSIELSWEDGLIR